MIQQISIEVLVETGTRQTVTALVERIEAAIREEVSLRSTLSFPICPRPIDITVYDR